MDAAQPASAASPPPPPPAAAASGPLPAPPSGGVSNCYVFKSRLQEYAQKVGIPTPVYETVKEGPSHDPVFKSTVIVNNARYDSLPGFFNRKAAEQSAAEIALMELHKSGQMKESIPVVESGLCKNLLQEYAQKMNYAIPSYVCEKLPLCTKPFTCKLEIGGIQYMGTASRTKREAELKAARTALLAIKSSSVECSNGTSEYTVLPGKKKLSEAQPEVEKQLKPVKTAFKKKWPKKRHHPRKRNAVKANKGEPGTVKGDEDASYVPSKDVDSNKGSCSLQQLEGQIGNGFEQGSSNVKSELGITFEVTEMSTVERNESCQAARQVSTITACRTSQLTLG